MENNYQILSFDVGIKNLAFCLINFNHDENKITNIEDWGLINLKSDLWVPDHNEKRCQGQDKKGNICGKTSNGWIIKDGKRTEMCRVHSKPYEKNFFDSIKTEHNFYNQNGDKLGFEYFPYELRDLKCHCGDKSRKFFSKIIIPEIAEKVVGKNTLVNVKIAGFCNKCSKLFKKDYPEESLMKICDYLKEDDTKIYSKLYEGLSTLSVENLNEVVIENQPALKNPRMKSIQMFIYSFFFIGGKNATIKNLEGVTFFSATKKLNPTAIVEELLKKVDGEKVEKEIPKKGKNKKKEEVDLEIPKEEEVIVSEYQAYKKRKNDSVAIVTEILNEMENWKSYFATHPKKDDLADSLLQGIAQWSMHSSKKEKEV